MGFNPPPGNGLGDIVDWPPGKKESGWSDAPDKGERDGYDMVPVNTVVNCFFLSKHDHHGRISVAA